MHPRGLASLATQFCPRPLPSPPRSSSPPGAATARCAPKLQSCSWPLPPRSRLAPSRPARPLTPAPAPCLSPPPPAAPGAHVGRAGGGVQGARQGGGRLGGLHRAQGRVHQGRGGCCWRGRAARPSDGTCRAGMLSPSLLFLGPAPRACCPPALRSRLPSPGKLKPPPLPPGPETSPTRTLADPRVSHPQAVPWRQRSRLVQGCGVGGRSLPRCCCRRSHECGLTLPLAVPALDRRLPAAASCVLLRAPPLCCVCAGARELEAFKTYLTDKVRAR